MNLEQMREGWDRFAEAYDDAITPFSMRVAEDALQLAGIGQGMRVLDVAAGGGALSIPAARLGCEVVAADYSPAMVELLRSRARQHGLSNLTPQVMDGTALELEDDSFDAACSQLGIMLFPDRQSGLRELARVVKPGGTGVMVVFGRPERVQFFSMFFNAMRAAMPDISPSGSPLFSYQNPEDLKREMHEAGFSDVRVETRYHHFEVNSADEFWRTMQSSAPASAGLLAGLSDEQRKLVRDSLEALLRAEYGDGPARLPNEMHIGIGVK